MNKEEMAFPKLYEMSEVLRKILLFLFLSVLVFFFVENYQTVLYVDAVKNTEEVSDEQLIQILRQIFFPVIPILLFIVSTGSNRDLLAKIAEHGLKAFETEKNLWSGSCSTNVIIFIAGLSSVTYYVSAFEVLDYIFLSWCILMSVISTFLLFVVCKYHQLYKNLVVPISQHDEKKREE